MKLAIAATALILLASPAFAQDHSDHMAPPVDLPAICLTNAPPAAGGMGMSMGMSMSAPMGDAAHQDLMGGMDQMNSDMMAGGTATDIDVAFVCGMIPHHRGAIAMAKAELEHGDDAWAKSLAEGIIAAQEKEIADMLDWLAKQPQP